MKRQYSTTHDKYHELFGNLSELYDARNEVRERIYKKSRDITKSSKKIISALQRITHLSKDERSSFLTKARVGLEAVCHAIHDMAIDLRDPFNFSHFWRTYSGGLQEFIEALSLYNFLLHGTLITLEEVNSFVQDCKKDGDDNCTSNTSAQGELKQNNASEQPRKKRKIVASSDPGEAISSDSQDKPAVDAAVDQTESQDDAELAEGSNANSNDMRASTALIADEKNADDDNKTGRDEVEFKIGITDYVLGICDLSGELMRVAINSVTSQDFEGCEKLCQFTNEMYSQLLALNLQHRELPKKLRVMLASIRKVENVCYKVHIRGEEYPPEMLQQIIASAPTPRESHGEGE